MDSTLTNISCIILAGGKGTRLQSVISDVPKPMAPINGIPLLERMIQHLYEQGVQHFILSVGYKKEVIIDYFTSKERPYFISFSEEDTPLGTGGAIQKALNKATSEFVLVLNGDTFFDIDIQNFVKKALAQHSECTLALHSTANNKRYGSVQIQNNQILSFQEKSSESTNLINGGIYFIHKQTFLNRNLPEQFSFEQDYLEKYVGEHTFTGFEENGYFIDIGIPEDYKKAQHDFT
jgi:D-glycero-alpha-D-manno-heptose 1-phosphate guanylyltransferase